MPDSRKKIAVVLTHGMGEADSNGDLTRLRRCRVGRDNDAQWRSPPDERPAEIRFKPDVAAGSFELRRITTRWTRSKAGALAKGPRVDFFEFYWADLAEGTTVHEIWDWLRTLLQRWPSEVPNGLMGVWILLWVAVAIVTILSMLAISPWPGLVARWLRGRGSNHRLRHPISGFALYRGRGPLRSCRSTQYCYSSRDTRPRHEASQRPARLWPL